MRDTIELVEMSTLVNSVVETVFEEDETAEQWNYKPEYIGLITAYFEIKYYFADEYTVDNIQDFYVDYISGVYTESLNKINPRQREEITNAINNKIEYVKAQRCNPLNNALASLINIVQGCIDRFSDSFGELTADDIKNIAGQAENLSNKINDNTDDVVKAVFENAANKKMNKSNDN